MAEETKEPKGHLDVQIQVRLPQASTQMYQWLNHPLPSVDVSAFSCGCTQREARLLVEKIRAANNGLEVKAKWTGDLGL